jgi:hypothetical protein
VWTIIGEWKFSLIAMTFFNGLVMALQMTMPTIMKYFVDFINTGDIAISFISFIDTSENEWLKFLTKQRQYGLLLSFMVIFIQAITFILTQHITFRQTMIGTQMAHAIIGLIYEK